VIDEVASPHLRIVVETNNPARRVTEVNVAYDREVAKSDFSSNIIHQTIKIVECF
jgi:hypothetical protein